MPHVETTDDLAEWWADKMGIYGGCRTPEEKECDGSCRACFVFEMKQRIREAVANERILDGAAGVSPTEGGGK